MIDREIALLKRKCMIDRESFLHQEILLLYKFIVM